uniref:Uncharacterized protein n=1 Tax=Alexandrium catenella TaxID=2925 RepID=A0A7S1WQD3_ALECA
MPGVLGQVALGESDAWEPSDTSTDLEGDGKDDVDGDVLAVVRHGQLLVDAREGRASSSTSSQSMNVFLTLRTVLLTIFATIRSSKLLLCTAESLAGAIAFLQPPG